MRHQKVLLTLFGIPLLTDINAFVRLKGGKICLGYPILWEKADA
jgi:hypothetical protein